MASSTGASSGLRNSSSEEDLQQVMDQRKRKRMLSNRESARRSRMRKQKRLDDLTSQATQLRKENDEILTRVNITSQLCMNVVAENTILRAQMAELSQRLGSLNEIINYVNLSRALLEVDRDANHQINDDCLMMNPWSSLHVNQPIMDMVMY